MKLKKMKLALCAGAALLAVSMTDTATAAGSTTGNLTVTATVSQNCTLTTTTVAFGAYDPVAANSGTGVDKTATGAVNVTCTAGSSGVDIKLDTGANPTHAVGTTRAMASGGNYLSYELYQPTATTPGAACGALTTVWNDSANKLTPTGVTWTAATAQVFNVCGDVPKGQNASAGSYTDTVVATVDF